jgi:hypothetical protein
VGEREKVGARPLGLDEALRGKAALPQQGREPAVLAHREAMPLRQSRLIGRVGDNGQNALEHGLLLRIEI